MMKAMAMTILLVLLSTPAISAETGMVEEGYLYPGFQYFTWSEFAASGSRLVRESGPLYGLGGATTLNLYDRRLLLQVKGELFGGDVDYRGETQSSADPALSRLPVTTDTVYFGGRLEVDAGWRMPLSAGSVEPFAGFGYRGWVRDLKDSATLDGRGNPVQVGGYSETWHMIDTKLGVRLTAPLAPDMALFVEGGARYPLMVQNQADFPGIGKVTVQPEGQWSGFAEVGCRFKRFRPSLFYEGYHAGQSPVNKGLVQPRAVSDTYGINLGLLF